MSTFGTLFTVSTFGESHCPGVGCIVNGIPPRMSLCEGDIQKQLSRRRPGQSKITTPRDEKDRVRILSGIECGVTLGTPVALLVMNEDQRPGDYGHHADIPRPSHADWTYQEKYGVRASSGGGRASARETIGRVAAGAIAEKWLFERYGVRIIAYVSAIADVELKTTMTGAANSEEYKKQAGFNPFTLTREQVDATPVRCPDADTSRRMQTVIERARDSNDSVGGVVTCFVTGLPAGWGEPVFDKLQATIAHAMLSIPATKGFELGSGFAGTKLPGSRHNDMFTTTSPTASTRLGTVTNYSGGIQGGISNGEYLYFRVAFKPAATISRPQSTVSFDGSSAVLETKGRHDPSVVPRAVPIVESMIALVLADAALIQEARVSSASIYPLMGKLSPHAPALVQQTYKPNDKSNPTATATATATATTTTTTTTTATATATHSKSNTASSTNIPSYPYNANSTPASPTPSSTSMPHPTQVVNSNAAHSIPTYPFNAATAATPSRPLSSSSSPPSPSRLRAPPPTVADFSHVQSAPTSASASAAMLPSRL